MSTRMGVVWSHFRILDDPVVAFGLLYISSLVSASNPATTLLPTSSKVAVSQEEIFISAGVCALGIIIFILGLVALIIAIRRYGNSAANQADVIHFRGKTYSRRGLHNPAPYIIDQNTSGRSTYLDMGIDHDHGTAEDILQDVDVHALEAYRRAVQNRIVRDLRRIAASETARTQGFRPPRNHSAPNIYEDLETGHGHVVLRGASVDTPGYTSVVNHERHVHFSDFQYSRPQNLSVPHHVGHQIYEDMGGAFSPMNRGHPPRSHPSWNRDRGRPLSGQGALRGYPWDISPPSPLLDRCSVSRKEDGHCSIENRDNDAVSRDQKKLSVAPSNGNLTNQTSQFESPEIMNRPAEENSVMNTEQDRIFSKTLYTSPALSKKTNSRQKSEPKATSVACLGGDVSIETIIQCDEGANECVKTLYGDIPVGKPDIVEDGIQMTG